MLVHLSKKDAHTSEIMGADTVALCKMQGFQPRLENQAQSREEANAFGYKAEFAVARLFDVEPPAINVLSDGGVDLWIDDTSVDVKFTNQFDGPLIFDSLAKFRAQLAILVCRTDDDDVMKVSGWISRKEFKNRAEKADFGYGLRLYMEAHDLHPIESLWKHFMQARFGGEA